MSVYEQMDDGDLPGELDIDCAWCGEVVYDRNATVINGRRFCENCAVGHPEAQNIYNEGLYCSLQEVLATYGYNDPTGKSQVCTLTQVANRVACEGS